MTLEEARAHLAKVAPAGPNVPGDVYIVPYALCVIAAAWDPKDVNVAWAGHGDRRELMQTLQAILTIMEAEAMEHE